MQRNESRIEEVSLKDLERICKDAKEYGINLILIGGYAVRAFTNERSWRFTKDIDFITKRKDLTALRGVFDSLKYSFEKTEYGVKGGKKINKESIELHISVDKVIDWSTGLEYVLLEDVFKKAVETTIKPYFEENRKIEVGVKAAPVEDILIMKLMTERMRDHFDAITIIIDSFEKLDMERFWRNYGQSNLEQHIRRRLNSFLADIKKGLIKKLWKEFTGREFIREQEVILKNKINKILEK
ncbi:MAG: nucleotidyl transferase AbiEii/AbiGii toxin family protein [Candidatus Bathyarchaeia archaeon]